MINIEVIGCKDGSRRWEGELLTRLRAIGHAVCVRHEGRNSVGAPWLDRVLALEERRFGPSLASPAVPLVADGDCQPDLVIDLTGSVARRAVPTLTLTFSGRISFSEGLTQFLATGESPCLRACLDGVPVGEARPMLSDRLWLSRACNDLLSGAITLIESIVVRFAAGRIAPLTGKTEDSAGNRGFLRHYLPFLARGVAGRVGHKLRLGARPFYWQVAYRLVDGEGIAETGALDGPPFSVLADDGKRFYADPFVFMHADQHYLFVEEFPYATAKGIVSVARLEADGRFGVPQAVLEEPHHLSYPQVFAHRDEIYMIPESGGARELVLYRAEPFPDHWVRDTVLLQDVDFNDATLLEAGGRFWLFGTQRYGQGSASDTMAVYSAPALRGPWLPHALNPIRIDHSASRPGGAFIHHGGKLVLPVQNGAQTYGGGLALMELLQLDNGDVRFALPEPIVSGPAWRRNGIHTLNRAGRVEVVDSAG